MKFKKFQKYCNLKHRNQDLDKLTVNSVTWIELAIGSNNPASLYIASIKATQEVDLPSL